MFFDADLTPTSADTLVNFDPMPPDSYVAAPAGALTGDARLGVAWDFRSDDLLDEENVVATSLPFPAGDPAAETMVNTTTAFSQRLLNVVATSGGEWIVVWQNEDLSEPYDLSVRFRRYLGSTALSEEVVPPNPTMPYARDGMAIKTAVGADLFWSATATGINWQVFATHIDTDSQMEATALSAAAGVRLYPCAATFPNGNVIVAWRTEYGPQPAGIYTRAFDSDFHPLTPETPVWVDPLPSQFRDKRPHIAVSPSGQHAVVVWVLGDDRANRRDRDVVAQVVDPSGYPIDSAFYVPRTAEVIDQRYPLVTYVSDSTFAAVWSSNPDPTSREQQAIVGRLFEVNESAPACGDANTDGALTATDALAVLGTAVGTASCDACLCDVNGSGKASASDALATLRGSVGLPISVECPPCSDTAGLESRRHP